MTEEIDYITRFEDFFKSYKTEEGVTPYHDAISRLSLENLVSISVDFNHLLTFDPDLAAATKEKPQQAIEAASAAIKRILRIVDPDYYETTIKQKLHARFKEVPDRVSVRTIRSENISQLIMVDALVTRVSDVKPLLVEGIFKCRQCQDLIGPIPQGNQFVTPTICPNDTCRSKGPFELIPERSKFVDWQKIRLQEKPEELPPGALPRALDCILQDDIVDTARPGDPCRVVGILRSTQDVTARSRRKAPTFSVFLATNYVEVSEREADRIEIEPKEEKAIIELSQDPLVHRKLVNSIAPSIYGLTDLKEAVCLLLFGGVSKVLADGVKIRGDSNILIVGDPGTAKSQLLKYVAQIAPRGLYTSGKGSTAAGLTAAVLRDPDTEGFALEAGALVLADRGTACLHPSSRIILNNELMTIEEVFNRTTPVRAISNDTAIIIGALDAKVPSLTNDLDLIECESTYIRKKSSPGSMIKISTQTGFQTIITADHMLLDGSSIEWKMAREFNIGDYLIAPLKLPGHNNPVHIIDTIPDNWIVCLSQDEKNELRIALLKKFQSLAQVNKFFTIRRDVLSGRSQMKVGTLRHILHYLDIFGKWKKRKLSFGRKQSGERLKVSTITPELAYFLGFVYGDGWDRINNRRSSLSIRQSMVNDKQIKQVIECYSTVSPRSLRNYPRKTESEIRGTKVLSDAITLTAHSNLLAQIYHYLTSNHFANLLKLPDSSLSAFIAGIVDTDGCISIKRSTKQNKEYKVVHIDIQCSNNQLENQSLLLALRRFDCYGCIKPDHEVSHIQITGRNDIEALLSVIRPFSVKIKPLPVPKRKVSGLSDKIPSKPVSQLARNISQLNTSMLVDKRIWSTIYAYKHEQYNPSRGQLQKIQSRLEEHLTSSQHETINNLLKRDYFLDPIESIEEIQYTGPVYDLYVPNTHNFLADGLITHNCIDEFDKMRPQDRTAIHEAMEQHSYHPFTEILLPDGSRPQIGSLVDGLFEQNATNAVQGINCEILDVRSLGLELYTLNQNKVQRILVDRVSRHPAPDYFFKITYSNGRSIIVTPEHPVFVFEDDFIATKPASEIQVGNFVPAPRVLPYGHNPGATLVNEIPLHHNAKTINLPERLTPEIARLLGYYLSEGYSYDGSSAELGFSNTLPEIVWDISSLMQSQFGLEGIDYINRNRTLRFVSSQLRDFFQVNFPELLSIAKHKRVPSQIFISGEKVVQEFLKAAFLGDGSLESEALSYRTSSYGLACDYQDLLLSLQIQSRINFDSHNDSYKVYIRGSSLPRFFNLIVASWDPRLNRIKKVVNRSKMSNYEHDVFPATFGMRIIRLLQKVGVPYKGTFYRAIQKKHGITRKLILKHLQQIKRAYEVARKTLKAPPTLIKGIRVILRWSQQTAADKISKSRSFIDYLERGGYNSNIRSKTRSKLIHALNEELAIIGLQLTNLDNLLTSDVGALRIKAIEKINNSDKYACQFVYDVTVEPTHQFISQGLLLHNTVSIAKAGIVATLNARTAILAAANPNLGRYVAERSFSENVNLPVTLLSRFDLIFALTDLPESERDERTAEHIIALHQQKGSAKEPPVPTELLRKYIAYARRSISPTLTDEALNVVKDFYLGMRKSGERENAPIPITARQLESLIRLAEAHAKMALREKVIAEDAQAAIRLVQVSLQQVGFDHETGEYDVDNIMIGRPRSQREKLRAILMMIRDLAKESPSGVPIDKIMERAKLSNLSETFVQEAINQLVKEGEIYSPRPGILLFAGS